MQSLFLRPGKDKQVRNGHPWVFSGALVADFGQLPSQIIRLYTDKKKFLGYGIYNPHSKISIRILHEAQHQLTLWNDETILSQDWWNLKIREAFLRRERIFNQDIPSSFRLLFGEADFVPGCIIDCYDNTFVIQLSLEYYWLKYNFISQNLQQAIRKIRPEADTYFIAPDAEILKKEGISANLIPVMENQRKRQWQILENQIIYTIDVLGQKTGFYLDQRWNRQKILPYTKNKSVIDCFCYSGGFSLPILKQGVESLIAIDSSAMALEIFRKNLALNFSTTPKEIELVQADCYEYLRSLARQNQRYDVVILDPPKLAKKKEDLPRAMRSYKDINMQAIQCLKPQGILVTFSCSGAMNHESLRTAIAWAAKDCQRSIHQIETLGQAADHPILLTFPESEYLKGGIFLVD